MARTTRTTESYGAAAAAPSLIRWGAVFGGAVVGLSLLILLSTLWFALAYGNGMEQIETNLAWYVAGSAVLCMFIGGLVAGWLSGVPGAGPGFFNGLTVWSMILLASLAIGVPSLSGAMGLQFDLSQAPNAEDLAAQGDGMWAGFVSLLVGALTAGIGGMIGGAITRPAFAPMTETVINESQDRPMPIGASDRGYDLSDERSYDRSAIPPDEHRPTERIAGDAPRTRSEADGWSSTT
jgi:hypothetical protein